MNFFWNWPFVALTQFLWLGCSLFAFGVILITWMCFLGKQWPNVNTRATERAAGMKSLKVRMLLYSCQEERPAQVAELNGIWLCSFCPTKSKSFGLLSFEEKNMGLHSLKGRTAMEKKCERFEMIGKETQKMYMKWLKHVRWGWGNWGWWNRVGADFFYREPIEILFSFDFLEER